MFFFAIWLASWDSWIPQIDRNGRLEAVADLYHSRYQQNGTS
jgi:hypothetical protein